MSNQKSINSDLQELVFDLLMSLIRALRSSRKISSEELDRLFFADQLEPDLSEEKTIYSRLVNILLKENQHLSGRTIYSILIGHVVKIGVFYKDGQMSESDIEEMAKAKIGDLFRYTSTREIDFPLACLKVNRTPFKFGKVTFRPLSKVGKDGKWWKKIKDECRGNPYSFVCSFARVTSPGDYDSSFDYANMTVRETLLILRGLGFPIVSESIGQFGMLNEFPVLPTIPYRIQNVIESVRLESSPDLPLGTGGPQRDFEINKLLQNVPLKSRSTIDSLLTTDQKVGEMASKLISGLRWIGAATKPDTLSARYIKLATALEILVGGGDTRGISALLAERSAFLLGKTFEEREQIDKDVGKLYNLRSKIVHGSNHKIQNDEFEQFGILIRKVAFALCSKLIYFNNLNEFMDWIVKQRYS